MNNLKKIIAIIAFVALACHSTNSKKHNDLPSQLNAEYLKSVLSEYRIAYDIPALVIGIFTPDTIIIAADGIKDVVTKKAITTADQFHIGSCTKAMTAFMAARLIEKGILSWDTKIVDAFPEWEQDILDFYKPKTMADLLSHRAGIQPFLHGIEFKDVPKNVFQGSKKEQREKFARWLLQRDPTIDATKKYIYSNAGYTVAAAILEKLTNKSWEELIQAEVFSALKITGRFGWATDTSSNQPLGHIQPVAWNLSNSPDWIILPDSLHYDCQLLEPGGDISMAMYDYCIFLQENLRALIGHGSLLKQSTYQILHYGSEGYSMGWGNPYERGHHYLSHDGSAGTFYCRNLLCKEEKYGFAIFANSGNETTMNGILKLSDVIMRIIENDP
jgi:CubicO group peptidase (beta-lactamase class C family)